MVLSHFSATKLRIAFVRVEGGQMCAQCVCVCVCSGLPGLAFSRPKYDKFGLFYIGWPGHLIEFIKYLAFFKVYRRFCSKIKTFFIFKTDFGIFR